ncbi:putative COPII vesicles protein Yip3 [Aspergillus mulundensis]|uniref:PRA1 family protein n=1 Tax=Aspergillus mulundensis TaxID=1810919 RepID=A0A3D8Q6I5_9EURO|nr:PRA1 family protein [Aspergillus mulundensis]RDW57431.1 PRA1 family protein [Aspergillus mulundensis]
MSSIQIPIDAITSRFGDRFNSLRSQSLGSRFANLRPISEFLDFKRISKPANFGETQSRVNYNLSYFSSNYAAIFVLLSIYSLLTNPMLLFVIVLVTGSLWGIGKLDGRDLDLGFARFNTSQLYTGLLLVAVPLTFWASPIYTFFWLVGATGVTVFGHAAFMDKPIENAFSEEAV